MRITGIIEYSMETFLCIRGFAPMIDLCEISESAPDVQRPLIDEHRGEMERFLNSGEFTFFPEVILCANLMQTPVTSEKIDLLRIKVKSGEAIKGMKIAGFTISSSVYKRKQINNSMAFDRIQSVYLDFEKEQIQKLYRIDGNHRLNAVDNNSKYKNLIIPFCILMFRDKEETNKFCRALFHNINSKQIPLKLEQNLQVIIKGESVFTDDMLKTDPSFGYNYYLARKVINEIDLQCYPSINVLISESKYTYFVEIFKILIERNLIEPTEEAINIIKSQLSEINNAIKDAHMEVISENVAILGAISYYKLVDNNKCKAFLTWVEQNGISNIKELHINDLLNIYDNIYRNSPKVIFMSMWFNEKTEDTFQTVNDVKDTIKRDYDIDINIIKVDEHTDGNSSQIYDRICSGINACSLVIADLSYGNKNVHHEIGYALGRGKSVLLLYNQVEGRSAGDDIGSNLSMHDQLRFKTQTDLRHKLIKKIRDFYSLD